MNKTILCAPTALVGAFFFPPSSRGALEAVRNEHERSVAFPKEGKGDHVVVDEDAL